MQREDYHANSYGIITDPGKFEGEMIYAPYFWESLLDGFSDDDVNGTAYFVVSDDDRKQFPEIGDIYGVALEEDSQGFVRLESFATREEYDKARESQRMDEEAI